MSRISMLAGNDILIHGKTSKRHECNHQREESFYHRDTMPRSGPSASFLKSGGIMLPPILKGLSAIDLIPGGEDIKDRSGKIVNFQGLLLFIAAGLLHLDIPVLTFSQETSKPCGNDMIDAHVGTLLDSKLPTGFPQSLGKVSDFSTIIWITATQLPTLPQSLLLLFFLIFKKRKRMFMIK
ncbi:MAG TPA: hypothetical protein ENI27_09310, partial [bacterium]|nr:hypothetical protein [bacterium]